jgi:hypothetical protein
MLISSIYEIIAVAIFVVVLVFCCCHRLRCRRCNFPTFRWAQELVCWALPLQLCLVVWGTKIVLTTTTTTKMLLLLL